MEITTLRLIHRKPRLFDAAKAAHELFKSQKMEISKSQISSGRAEPPTRVPQVFLNRNIEVTGHELDGYSGENGASRASQGGVTDRESEDIAPGDAIFVLWKNQIWYPATCLSKEHSKVEFRWLDPGNYPSIGSAGLDEVRRRIIGSFEIAVGSPIHVKWSEDQKWYPAKFLSKHADTIQYEWETCGEFQSTGSVESSHVRIRVDESQSNKQSPIFLPCEDSVRRYNKDLSTAYRQKPRLCASTR